MRCQDCEFYINGRCENELSESYEQERSAYFWCNKYEPAGRPMTKVDWFFVIASLIMLILIELQIGDK